MNRAVQTMALAIFSLVFPAQTPAAEVKVWTSDVVSDETSPDAKMELKPVTLVGARNGSFSGKIVVESTGVIKGVNASVGALTGKDGAIPASNVQIRYAKAWDTQGWKHPKGPDILLDAAPEVAPVQGRTILPVWVTVHVPRETKAGVYDGEVTVQPEGAAQVKVKLTLDVADWTLPDPQDYRTWADYVQSPDTLALEYNVPLWSDKHWELIDRSFRYLSPTGCRVVYVPLICGTNFGNEQSMVRWIQKGENRYEWDYTLMDKYLDSAEKNLGKPKLVVFMVWDICMSKDALKRGLQPDGLGGEQIRKNREELLDKGPRVTGWNPATKEASVLILPRYEDEASKALWQPMFTEVKKRMEQRGLEKTIMLGMMPDLWPNKEEVTFWNDISGGRPWVIHGHSGVPKDVMIGNKGLYKIADIGYAAFVYNLTFNVNPDKGRMYGWKNTAILSGYTRFELNTDPAAFIRELQAFHITGGQRGAGRMGADLWPAVRNKKGERSGVVYSRYPENNWRNLDICDWQLAPGPDGAVATRRLEYFKEGTQVCEARIFLEDALLAADKKAKIGADLAQRCQVALDEHHRAMWKTVWGNDEDLNSVGVAAAGRNPIEGLWKSLNVNKRFSSVLVDRAIQGVEAKKGMEQFVVGWQEREKALYTLAGEVAAKLNSK
jgi:hypothetical protein